MINFLIAMVFYIPATLGLTFLNIYLLTLYNVSRKNNSKAKKFLFAFLLATFGMLLSWVFLILEIYILISLGIPVISKHILLLPIFWAFLLIPINILIRK